MQVRVYRPQKYGNKWRIRINRMGKIEYLACPSREEAYARYEALQQANGAVSTPLKQAVVNYEQFLSQTGRRPSSVETTMYRLRAILSPELERDVLSLDEQALKSAYSSRAQQVAGDTSRNELSEMKSFFKWLSKQGLCRDLASGIAPECSPKRSKGKEQLRLEEANKLLDYCLGRSTNASVAVAMALLLGLRASEIVNRTVRDFSRLVIQGPDGQKKTVGFLTISTAKTKKGCRTVPVPDRLLPHLLSRVENRNPTEPLLSNDGRHYRVDWLRKRLAHYCAVLGLPVVCAHSLRGTWATMARMAGLNHNAVADLLGHTNYSITSGHYVQQGTDVNLSIQAVSNLLGG